MCASVTHHFTKISIPGFPLLISLMGLDSGRSRIWELALNATVLVRVKIYIYVCPNFDFNHIGWKDDEQHS